MRAYPGTRYGWWLRQMRHDDQLIATAIDLATDNEESDDDGGSDG